MICKSKVCKMSYDEALAQRVRAYLKKKPEIEEKKMFGGLCFMQSKHMCCGIVKDTLMARVGPENYEACLKIKNVREMDFTGKALKGMVYVSPVAIKSDSDLAYWIDLCSEFVKTLPPKKK